MSATEGGRLIAEGAAVKTAIDPSGRMLIPKKLRTAASLAPGTVLDARCEGGSIVLVPAAAPVRIDREGRFFDPPPKKKGSKR